ncbi:Solute carrier family 15 member 2 [Araneus ventricosus]|uniref:Solute carrier family 15 member 2 n=1 Tax=Araneus ventricosus TaxID=182803 RepID=A0A4Y2GMA5_ARAVE|nr:Solute carrier family 15 member 2 [Araneus ventricosus]
MSSKEMSSSHEQETDNKAHVTTSVSQPDAIDKPKYPRCIPLLLIQEFCEKFSYYGFHAILMFYLIRELHYSEYTAFLVFHAFMALKNFSPYVGALIADSYLGKFWTVVHVSVWYAVGKIIVVVGSTLLTVPAMRTLSIIGFILVALCNGGLAPCLSAFGGDQFENHQEKERELYYSLFYFVIHFGNITASFFTPFLRSHVNCFGNDTCYPLAFGIPALLSIIGAIVFILGKPLYRIIPVKDRIFISVFKCIGHALTRKLKDKEEGKEHWLEYADDQFDKGLISDIKALFHVFQVYSPLAFFWTLYHQMGSAWVLQASRMDIDILGYRIPPDQMLLWHPVLILILIPIFKFGFYPLFGKLGILVTPLQKIATGGVLCALSFLLAGFVQLSIERDLPHAVQKGLSELTIINNSPCTVNMTGATKTSLHAFESEVVRNMLHKLNHLLFTPSDCSAENPVRKPFTPETEYESLMVTLDDGKLQVVMQNDSRIKLETGYPRVRIFSRTDFEFTSSNKNSSFLFLGESEYKIVPKNIVRPSKISMTDYWDLRPGAYKIYLPINDSLHEKEPVDELNFKCGGSYIVAIYQNSAANESKVTMLSTYKWNTVPVLLQLPQYLLMASGEIMFAISGISFSYSEAPGSMKSIVHAVWFFIYGTGNVWLLIIKSFIHVFKPSNQFSIFAVIMSRPAVWCFSIIALSFTRRNEETKRKYYYWDSRKRT